MPAKFHQIKKHCDECDKLLTLNNNRDIRRKRFCSRECLGLWTVKNRDNITIIKKMHSLAYTPEANKKKVHKGENHPLWIKDRSKVKCKRTLVEMRWWRKKIFVKNNYTCQKCGQVGGRLNAHHIKYYFKFPELRFNIANGITLCQECHKTIHSERMYAKC